MDPERGKEEEDGFGINPESRSKETRRCQRISAGREGGSKGANLLTARNFARGGSFVFDRATEIYQP